MRVLIFHGYLLRGTGSNVYNVELARALVAEGHDVDLICQDRAPEPLDFVDAVGDWRDGELRLRDLGRGKLVEHGRCTVYRPDIGGLLPVYVADRYEGFTAKTFSQLTEPELAAYLRRNVEAVIDVCADTPPDCALANHLVMGPCILARGLPDGVPYAVKVHGSAMEYTVRADGRFLPYAIEGLERSITVLVGSRHIAERLVDTVGDDGPGDRPLRNRIFLGPPGVDTERFAPRERTLARGGLRPLADRLEALPRRGYGRGAAAATAALREQLEESPPPAPEQVADRLATMHAGYDTAGIDADAPDALRALAEDADAPIVLYVGKLIVSKGVDLLIAAWPLVRARHPSARLLLVGFGAYREGLEMLLAALSAGDLRTAGRIAAGGRAFEGGPPGALSHLIAFFESLDDDRRDAYLAAAADMSASVHWTGRLEHDLLADLLPAVDVQVVPSTFPEAFGMVAAEAAACGVPPVCADHSGLAEVARILERPLSGVVASLLSFSVDDRSVARLAARITGLLELNVHAHADLSARLAETARGQFSWTGVARGLVEAAQGRHDLLRRP